MLLCVPDTTVAVEVTLEEGVEVVIGAEKVEESTGLASKNLHLDLAKRCL
jgi:hypothetical protein